MSLLEALQLTPYPTEHVPEGSTYAYLTVKVAGPYRVDLHEMLFNWRIVVSHADDWESIIHGWCYFGKGIDTFLKAVACAQMWDPTSDPAPKYFDKQAF